MHSKTQSWKEQSAIIFTLLASDVITYDVMAGYSVIGRKEQSTNTSFLYLIRFFISLYLSISFFLLLPPFVNTYLYFLLLALEKHACYFTEKIENLFKDNPRIIYDSCCLTWSYWKCADAAPQYLSFRVSSAEKN